jgi:hypothetical protein
MGRPRPQHIVGGYRGGIADPAGSGTKAPQSVGSTPADFLGLAAVSVLALTGCYSVLTFNVGSSSHEAASAGPPPAPEVQCAALAQSKVSSPIVDIDPMKTCLAALQQQKELDKKGRHK